jgi:site-specific DNA-cytosine methylase
MRGVSLFAGIGGLDCGFERAGGETILQVERDPFCQKVLAKHWPDVRRISDVHDVTAEECAGQFRLGTVLNLTGGNLTIQESDTQAFSTPVTVATIFLSRASALALV